MTSLPGPDPTVDGLIGTTVDGKHLIESLRGRGGKGGERERVATLIASGR